MKKGRKPAPIAVAKAKGYYRPSRHTSDIDESGQLEYITIGNIPEPPEDLSDKEKEQWRRTLTETSKFDGWIAKTDLPLFEMWCIQKVHLNDLNKEIKRHNEVNSDCKSST